jgi:hypothetical protein
MAVFWVVAPCSLVVVYPRFRGPCCLHHQGATTQKTAIFVLTAVRTSNPTWNHCTLRICWCCKLLSYLFLCVLRGPWSASFLCSVERRSACAGCITSFLYDTVVTFVRELLLKIIVYINHCLPSPPFIIFSFFLRRSVYIYIYIFFFYYMNTRTTKLTLYFVTVFTHRDTTLSKVCL